MTRIRAVIGFVIAVILALGTPALASSHPVNAQGFVVDGSPQLDDAHCVGTVVQILGCQAARRGTTIVAMLAPFAPLWAAEHPAIAAASVAPQPVDGRWQRLAQCESTNTNADTGNGFYGYFQFDAGTWRSVTGLSGVASDYSYATQLAGAQKLYSQRGSAPWPVCGPRAGL